MKEIYRTDKEYQLGEFTYGLSWAYAIATPVIGALNPLSGLALAGCALMTKMVSDGAITNGEWKATNKAVMDKLQAMEQERKTGEQLEQRLIARAVDGVLRKLNATPEEIAKLRFPDFEN